MTTTQAFLIIENINIIHFHDGDKRLRATRINDLGVTLTNLPDVPTYRAPQEKYSLNCSLSRIQANHINELLLAPAGQCFKMPRAILITATSIFLLVDWYVDSSGEIILTTFTSCDNTLVAGIPQSYREQLAELGISDMEMLGQMLTILRHGKNYEQKSMLEAFYSTYYQWSEAAHIKAQQFRQSLAVKIDDTIKDFYATSAVRPKYHIDNSSSGEIIITVKLPEGMK